jgi:hypothetical protein
MQKGGFELLAMGKVFGVAFCTGDLALAALQICSMATSAGALILHELLAM